jgi:ATP-dependent RNA helicase DDX3X
MVWLPDHIWEAQKKGKGKGGGGGKGKGGGGGGWGVDFGKMKRRNAQDMLKDAKNERESNYFWEAQARIGSSPPYALPKWKMDEEMKEIFKGNTGNVGINFDKFDEIPVEVGGQDSQGLQPIETFAQLWELYPLPDFLWTNLERCKYPKPTPIQKYAMPAALMGRDCMCCAQTGSGKTCAFLMPILACIEEASASGAVGVVVGEPAAPKAIVMAPTRELCSQIHLEARKLTFGSKVRASEVYGGVEAKPQLRELALGSDIVTATPGRLNDFINRGVMSMAQVQCLVLDEADRMLDMGFEPQIREIVQKHDMPTPQDGRMTLMFSATFPKEIQRLAQSFMRQYIWVGVGQVGTSADSITQNFITVQRRQKEQILKGLLKENPNDTTLVFTAMKRTAAALVEDLKYSGVKAEAIHGDMEQPQREVALQKFKKGIAKVLVATDVAARGLDIPTVTHVINFDLPEKIDDYVHRIGRTGRVGREGWATSLYQTDGNWANHKILRGLMDLFASKGKPVPDELAAVAKSQGMKVPTSKGGGATGWGGIDARGGQVQKHTWTGGAKAATTPAAGKAAGKASAASAAGKAAGKAGGKAGGGKAAKGGGNEDDSWGAAQTLLSGLKRALEGASWGDSAWKKGKW